MQIWQQITEISSLRCFPLDAPEMSGSCKSQKVLRIGKLGQLLSHVITEREVTLVQDQFKLLQVEQVPGSWFKEKDGKLKLTDMYWTKAFDIQNAAGERKYTLFSKVVKSCLSLQNSNASVERSLSGNRNTLRPEGNNLSDESFMGLRQLKEHARKCTGAEHVNTLDKGIIKEMQVAHSNYIIRKKEEEAERLLSESRKKEELKERVAVE